MRVKILLILSGLFFYFSSVQAQITVNCTTPVSNTFFQQKLNQINSTFDATSRYNQARTLASGNCLSSWQVKQVAMALLDDHDKLEFCKAAYVKTTDKVNFYDVYDAFAFFSSAFRLHDFVLSQQQGTVITGSTVINSNNNSNNDINFPVLPYPDHNQYLGPTSCNAPVSDEVFMGYARTLKNSRMNDRSKVDYARDIVNTQCLTTAHIMKLATLLNGEQGKLDLLKAGIPKVYDRGNYSYAQHVLSTQPFKTEFQTALFGQPNNTNNDNNTQTPCTVSKTDLDDIKKTVEETHFSSSKVTIAKQAIKGKKCFTVNQIKELMNLFNFDDSKLEIAKFSYDYCIDKDNYYKLSNELTFSSSKDDLTNFVNGRQ